MKKQNENNPILLSTFYFLLSRCRKGFTLVELIVAVGLFLTIVAIAVGSFIQSLRAQRQISGLILAQSNVVLVLEQMTREIRTGFDFCSGGNSSCSGPTELVFTNAFNETIDYRLNGVVIERGMGGVFGQITGRNVSIRYLNFILSGNESGDGWPPRITISVGVSGKEAGASATVVRLQTTVSARTIDT